MDKCDKCDGKGWIPYYVTENDCYYKTHKECNKCNCTGVKSNNTFLGVLGQPGDTGFIFGKRPK